MFAKVFTQIFDSSIASDYQARHVFIDLLALADSEGVVDMTLEAISRRTNVPIEIVTRAIQLLSEPDPNSRSPANEGRRITLIDSHRSWGWQITNYQHYREIRDEEARRSYFRDRQRAHRSKLKPQSNLSNTVKDSERQSNTVKYSQTLSTNVTYAEAEGEEGGGTPIPVKDMSKTSTPPLLPSSNTTSLRISIEKELLRLEKHLALHPPPTDNPTPTYSNGKLVFPSHESSLARASLLSHKASLETQLSKLIQDSIHPPQTPP